MNEEKIPVELIDSFSMQNKIPVHFIEQPHDINFSYIKSSLYSQQKFETNLKRIQNKEYNFFSQTDNWFQTFIKNTDLKDKKILIISNKILWHELFFIDENVSQLDVFVEQKQTSFTEKIDYIDNFENKVYDYIFCLHYVEKLGFGNFSEKVHPNADFIFLKNLLKNLDDCGKLILSLPLGSDVVYYPKFRVYGNERFDKLVKDYKLVEIKEFFQNAFDNKFNRFDNIAYEPLIVLEKKEEKK